jgi:hypothetical protein
VNRESAIVNRQIFQKPKTENSKPKTANRLLEVRLRNFLPHSIRQVANQQFIDEINRPDDDVDDQQNDGVIVKPANHGCVYA